MKLFIIFFLVLNLNIYAQINKGWNLIGINEKTSLQEIKSKNKYIKKALAYKNQQWTEISDIDNNDGIWIYSDNKFNSLNNNNSRDIIENNILLNKGWNLKSTPVNRNISPYVLNKNIYSYNKKWMSFNNDNKEITNLKPSSGYWIYSKEDINISLKDNKLIKANFKNNNELKTYIENVIINNKQFRYKYSYPMLEDGDKTTFTTPSTQKVSSETTSGSQTITATTTNLQEKDVDEIDVIKHNNKEIYFIQDGNVFLTSFEDIILNKKAVKKIIKNNNDNLNSYGMYLYKDKLIVFSTKNNSNNIETYRSIGPYYRNNNKVYIDIFNISNNKFENIKQYEIDGEIFTSRISNDNLYIINSFYPNYEVEYEKKESDCNDVIFYKAPCVVINYDKYKIISKSILPKIKTKDDEQDIVFYDSFYINPIKTNNLNIISAFSIDLETNNLKNSSSIDGNIHNFYASSDYIYLISSNNRYRNFYDYQNGSKIYSFSLKDKMAFSGEINIKGRINNKFSLSENNGILRVVTTQGTSWRNDTNNTLFIIKDNKIISSVESLGKKGETVKAVRFFGNKVFIVTFKQTDPLYTVDLSDPYNPKKTSELEISGFSTYIHYIDENHLLSIGRDADKEGRSLGIQLQLFNISNLSNTYLQSKLTIGDKYSSSSALYESKAFVYDKNSKLLSIDFNKGYNNNFIGFKVFKIENDIRFIKDIKKDIDSKSYYRNYSSILFNKSNKNYIGYINNENIQTSEIGE